MFDHEVLRRQLVTDLNRLHGLILKYAAGDKSVKRERDRLGDEVQLKLLRLRSVKPVGL